MQSELRLILIFSLMLTLLVPFAGKADVFRIDGVYLIVNNQMLTRSEALDTSASLKAQIEQSSLDPEDKQLQLQELDSGLLERLVQELLLLDRAEALRLEPSEQEIDQRLDQIAEKQPELFQAFPEQELQEQLVRDFKKQQVIGRDVESKIRTDEKDISRFCIEQLRTNRRIGLGQILFRGDAKAVQEKAEQVHSGFEKGVSFKELVEEFSEDSGASRNKGKLGYFKPGELLKVINDAAFALEVGQISPLVHSEFGYHLLYVYDEEIPKDIDCNKLSLVRKNQYANVLYNKEREALLKDYLEELWVCSRIEVREPFDSGLPGAAMLPEIKRPEVPCRVRMGAIRERAVEKAQSQKKTSRATSR